MNIVAIVAGAILSAINAENTTTGEPSHQPTNVPTSRYNGLRFICYYNDNKPENYAIQMTLSDYAGLMVDEAVTTIEQTTYYSSDYAAGQVNPYAEWSRSGIYNFQICSIFDGIVVRHCLYSEIDASIDSDYVAIGTFGIEVDTALNKYKLYIMQQINSDQFKEAFINNMQTTLENNEFDVINIDVIDAFNDTISITNSPEIADSGNESAYIIAIVVIILTLCVVIMALVVALLYLRRILIATQKEIDDEQQHEIPNKQELQDGNNRNQVVAEGNNLGVLTGFDRIEKGIELQVYENDDIDGDVLNEINDEYAQNIVHRANIKNDKEKIDQQMFNLHQENQNLSVQPQILALKANSTNTKICVSWKLQPVYPDSSFIAKINEKDNVNNAIVRDTNNDDNLNADNISDYQQNKMVDHVRDSMKAEEICHINIEWRYGDDEQNNIIAEGGEEYKWNTLSVDNSRILSFNLDVSVFDHILNTARFGLYHFRVTLYNTNKESISSKATMITTFKIKIRHIPDVWNLDTKHKQISVGFLNGKVITCNQRNVDRKFRNCFGTLVVSNGVNIWTLKIKKRDPNCLQCSAMIGVINMNNRRKNTAFLKTLSDCFAFLDIGYGIRASNGALYHDNKAGAFGKEIKEGDIVQIVCDYRQETISFKVNDIDGGLAFNSSHFPQQKMPNLGLAVSLKGRDEIQLIDFENKDKPLSSWGFG